MCLSQSQTSQTVKDLAHSAGLRTFSLFGTIFREYNLRIEQINLAQTLLLLLAQKNELYLKELYKKIKSYTYIRRYGFPNDKQGVYCSLVLRYLGVISAIS